MTKAKCRKTESKSSSAAPGKVTQKLKLRGKGNAKGGDAQRDETRRNDLCPILTVEQILIGELNCPARNIRRSEKEQIAKVAKSIEKFGFVKPILVDAKFEVVDGNVQLEAARQLGLETVPCIRVDHLSATEIRQLRVTLNKLQETGGWDQEVPRLEFEDFLEINSDISFTGFEIAEIDNILKIDTAHLSDEDDGSAIPDRECEPVSKIGDLWILENHRLLCGDALSRRDHFQLCGKEKAQMLYTDPPFNVPINGHVRGKGAKEYREFPMASGEMDAGEFEEFLTLVLALAVEKLSPGSTAYVFMDWRHTRELTSALERARYRLINLCVWVKPNGGMGSLYRSRHELVFVSVVGDEKHRNNVQLGKFGRNRTNVWEYAGATGGVSLPEDDFSVHPTVKPIQMAEDAILDVTAIDDIVLDLFLGSGSTLLAAERIKRRCFGMELDPAYVDLAIRRWQDMTGKSAFHAVLGEKFADVECTRRQGEELVDNDEMAKV